MARRRRDSANEQRRAEADAEVRRELRKLHQSVFWPFKTDRATAGASNMVDDSPYSFRRAAIHEDFTAERERLEALGLPLSDQVERLTEWWDTARKAVGALAEARGIG